MAEKSLYERIGGIYAISLVVDRFSDKVVENPKVGKGSPNPQLNEWSTDKLDRLPGLKYMRTLWVAAISGGPFEYTGQKLGDAHAKF
ncbi:MAG: truncated hemoglobin, partial [Halobacteriota archaeon]